MYKSATINQVQDIDGAAIEEWPRFQKYIFKKCKTEEEKFQMNTRMARTRKKEMIFLLQKPLLMHTSYIQHA